MPAYNSRIYGRIKPRGLPEVGQMAHMSSSKPAWENKPRDVDTPFRLPRLPAGSDPSGSVAGAESVASYQYRDYVTPSPELMHYRMSSEFLQMSGSPLKVPVKASFDYPRLKHAIIAPKAAVQFTRSGRPHLNRHSDSYNGRQSDFIRPQTALSDTGSIHWALGTARSVNFDQTGRSRHQGPFSRGFVRKCMAPPNWVRMKYGRTHSVL